MKFRLFVAAAAFAAPAAVQAGCVGTGSFRTCYDSSGNSYTISQMGGTTRVNGYNANTGNSWSQQSYRMGNTTQTYGSDAQGRSWNQTSTPYGSWGTASDGSSFYSPKRP